MSGFGFGRKKNSSSSTYNRRASHAGTWYTDESALLHEQLDGFLELVPEPSASNGGPESRVRALIAPHAGFSYSGATAAHAYAHLDPRHTQVRSLLKRYNTCIHTCVQSTVKYVPSIAFERLHSSKDALPQQT
jgi:AmmeMemoRadiSam system protein B